MNKKIKLGLFVFIFIGIILVSIIYYFKKPKEVKRKRKQNEIAILIKEDGADNYIKSTSKDIPKGDYTLNYEKSYCKNNGVIGDYDNTLGKVSFSFVGTDSCFLFFDLDSGHKGYETILLNNSNGAMTVKDAKKFISDKGTPDFSKIADTNEGMYAAEDDLGTSYYFRGAVDNNWVKFGKDSTGTDMYWRIIRINGDGSIRMIYTGTTAPTESTKVVMTGEGTQIGSYRLTDLAGGISGTTIMGYMYTSKEQHGNSTSSNIKTKIEDWYAETTLKDNPLISQNQIFCNDRSASSTQTEAWTPTGEFYYGAYGRLKVNKTPILTCPEESDKFTSKNSDIGNKALTYPVGLLTADEASMAGGLYVLTKPENTNFYLYTNQTYWLGSPEHQSSKNYNFIIRSTGIIYHETEALSSSGVRPVISLTPSVKLSGNGTWNNVYEVVN